jgi:hypothetical protein
VRNGGQGCSWSGVKAEWLDRIRYKKQRTSEILSSQSVRLVQQVLTGFSDLNETHLE